MPNYTLVADTTFKNRSFDDLIRPFQMYTEVYNQMADSINELDTKASVWEGMANEQSDPVAYAQYKRYADELRTQAKLIATNGTSPSTRQDVLNLRRRYASEIAPIENAYTTRKEQATEQRMALNADPTLLLSRRADATSLDDYLANPTLGYESYSGAVLASQVGNAAKALAKELKNYGNGKRLDAYTKTWIEQHGFTADEVAHAINNPDDPKSSKVLRTLVDNVMADSGIHRWADYPTLSQAYNYARQGLWEAVGVDNVHQYEDYGERLNAQIEHQKKQAEEAKKAALAQRQYMRRNIFTQRERDDIEKAKSDWDNYQKYFIHHSDGRWELTEEGKELYNAMDSETKNPKFWAVGTSAGNVSTYPYISIDVGSDFKKFVDKWVAPEKNMTGEEFENRLNDRMNHLMNVVNDKFDATMATEYYNRLDPSNHSNIVSLMNSLSNEDGELPVYRRTNDNGTYSWVRTGDEIDVSKLKTEDVKSVELVYGLHGRGLDIRLKNGKQTLIPLNNINTDYEGMLQGTNNEVLYFENELKNGRNVGFMYNGRLVSRAQVEQMSEKEQEKVLVVPIWDLIQNSLQTGLQNISSSLAPIDVDPYKVAAGVTTSW